VALGASYSQFSLYRPNGLLWSLVACSVTVPAINRWLPDRRYTGAVSRDARTPIDAGTPVTMT